MALELNLTGKTAAITGASEGIGKAIAEKLGEEGVDMWIAARTQEKIEAVAAAIEAAHGVRVTPLALDLSSSADQQTFAKAADGADILINNAGAIPKGKIHEIDEATWRRVWDLKVFGYINLCREFYARMKARGDGVIINIIGNGGEKPVSDYIAGSTGNAALMAFTRALGGDAPKDGLRVVGINPGPIATEKLVSMMKKAAADQLGDETRYEEFFAPFGFGRAGTCEEVADMTAFLASPRSAYTTGTILTVDGGMITKGPLF